MCGVVRCVSVFSNVSSQCVLSGVVPLRVICRRRWSLLRHRRPQRSGAHRLALYLLLLLAACRICLRAGFQVLYRIVVKMRSCAKLMRVSYISLSPLSARYSLFLLDTQRSAYERGTRPLGGVLGGSARSENIEGCAERVG